MQLSSFENNVTQPKVHQVDDLIKLFEQTFYADFNTKVVKGDDEPIYLPANEQCPYHQIIFAHGFYASALHEIAHWCLAGPKRRLLEDFGYWYLPDGRNAEQQAKFEQAEIKPQAIEWALSVACGKAFDVSVDNLNGEAEPDRFAFKAKVWQQVQVYLSQGFPPQSQQLIQALAEYYQVPLPLTLASFQYGRQIKSQANFAAQVEPPAYA